MPDLEARLRALADEPIWPETPDLTGVVTAALAERRAAAAGAPTRRSSRRRVRLRRRAVALAAVLLVAIPTAGAAAFPSARDDVLEWLGLRHTEVRRTPTLPPAQPPGSADLGERTTLEDAVRRTGFRPLLPARLGDPDAIHVAGRGAASRITLVYAPRPGLPTVRGVRAGLLVTQVRGRIDGQLLRKIAAPGTGVTQVRIDGHPGVVFTGADHVYLYLDPAGQFVEGRPFLAGTTLVLERDGSVVRLEAAVDPQDLRRIAETLRLSPRG
jgi:hypothetical protein